MAGGGNSREENYWPGFVDALSNVVLTLVFVLVVFVFAMAMSANKVEQRMQEIKEAEAKLLQLQDQKPGEQGFGAEIGAGQSQQVAIQEEGKSVEVAVQKTEEAQTRRGATTFEESSDRLIIFYPNSIVAMDENSIAKLNDILAKSKEKATNYGILIRSYTGPEPFSQANRLAYYRALTVRKHLIDNGFGENANIETKVLQPSKPADGHVEIIFTAQ